MNPKKNAFGRAVYIKAQSEPSPFSPYDPAPLFRRAFEWSGGEIREAELLIQSPGFAEVYLNGEPVTEDRFISPISDYRRILWYNRYDVTERIREGANVLGAMAGNGFFNESFRSGWPYDTAPWRDAPQILICLRINGQPILVSDGSWRVSREESPIVYNHLRSGETYDARRSCDGWLTPDFDDSHWERAIPREAPVTAELREARCQPVRECEVIEPVSVRQTDRGYLVDFGVTVSGYMEITLREERGREIIFHYAEEVDGKLAPKHNRMDQPPFYIESPFQQNRLIASGELDTFKPRFSYHGFRYVLIEGMTRAPDLTAVKAYFVHQDVARRATFESGNGILNFIYSAGIRSTYSNLFWSLTDCPTREKLGWTNDAQASVEQTLINFDILPLYEKWFEDLKSCMREDGSLPGVIPSPDWGYDWGPVCDCLLYELPYRVWLYTGDTKMMTEAIPYFERYAGYLDKKVREGAAFELGDWLGYKSSPRIPKNFVTEWYLLKAWRLTALAHRLAGSDGTPWQIGFEERRTAFMKRYLNGEGRCVIEEQCSVAMMLAEGLYRDRQTLGGQLAQTVERDSCQLTCGMVGVQVLYDALTESGRPDLAFRVITESNPGYRTWYEWGATTLWERWDGTDYGSHNHHMFSGVIAWFFKSLLGIAPREDAPAFELIELRPCFLRELGFVRGEMQTVRGTVSAEWQFTDDGVSYTVTVPDGVTAFFRDRQLQTGENQFFIHNEEI